MSSKRGVSSLDLDVLSLLQDFADRGIELHVLGPAIASFSSRFAVIIELRTDHCVFVNAFNFSPEVLFC